jgi:hypothetical protein
MEMMTAKSPRRVPEFSNCPKRRTYDTAAKIVGELIRLKTSGQQWAAEPIVSFVRYVTEVHEVLETSIYGLQRLTRMPELVEALDNLDKVEAEHGVASSPSRGRPTLEETRQLASFAKTQIERGFPVLHAQGLVSIWGRLEALIQDFVASWIEHVPGVLEREELARLKVPLAEFLSLSREDLVDEVVRELGLGLRYEDRAGIARFEALLSAIGLPGSAPQQVRRDLTEMHQVRNLVVHRASTVDRRFLRVCPWMTVKAGHKLTVGCKELWQYSCSAYEFVREIISRVCKHFEIPAETEPAPDARQRENNPKENPADTVNDAQGRVGRADAEAAQGPDQGSHRAGQDRHRGQ